MTACPCVTLETGPEGCGLCNETGERADLYQALFLATLGRRIIIAPRPRAARPSHIVAARLAEGWVSQVCPDRASAIGLFDRLRQSSSVDLRRVENGRVVEIRALRGTAYLPDPAPTR